MSQGRFIVPERLCKMQNNTTEYKAPPPYSFAPALQWMAGGLVGVSLGVAYGHTLLSLLGLS